MAGTGSVGSGDQDVAVVDRVRALLDQVGGLFPAVTEHAPITRVPGVTEPWLHLTDRQLVVRIVVHWRALPALPRLLAARDLLAQVLARPVELVVVDLVDQPPAGEPPASLTPAPRRPG